MATARLEKRTVQKPVMQAVEEEVVVVEMTKPQARDVVRVLAYIDGPGDKATHEVWEALSGVITGTASFKVTREMQTEAW